MRHYVTTLLEHKSENTRYRNELLSLIHAAEQYHGQQFIDCPADSTKVLVVQEYAHNHQPEEIEYNHRGLKELPADELSSLNESIAYLLGKGYVDDEIENILEISSELLKRCYLIDSKLKQSRDKANRDHSNSAMWLVHIKDNLYNR